METKGAVKAPPVPTRLKAAETNGQAIHLPPNPAPYLTDWLFEIGPSSANGMGESPIGFTEMVAWQSLMAIEIQHWEARILRRLSRDFVGMRHDARERHCPAPYDPVTEDRAMRRDKVADQFKALAGALAGG